MTDGNLVFPRGHRTTVGASRQDSPLLLVPDTDKTTSEGASEGSPASHAERLRETIFSCAAGSPGFLKSFPPFPQKLLFVGRLDLHPFQGLMVFFSALQSGIVKLLDTLTGRAS